MLRGSVRAPYNGTFALVVASKDNLVLVKKAGGFLTCRNSPKGKSCSENFPGFSRGRPGFIRHLLNQLRKFLGTIGPDCEGALELPDAGPVFEIES